MRSTLSVLLAEEIYSASAAPRPSTVSPDRTGRRNTPRRIIRLGSSGPSDVATSFAHPAEKLAGAGGLIASAGVNLAALRTATNVPSATAASVAAAPIR